MGFNGGVAVLFLVPFFAIVRMRQTSVTVFENGNVGSSLTLEEGVLFCLVLWKNTMGMITAQVLPAQSLIDKWPGCDA